MINNILTCFAALTVLLFAGCAAPSITWYKDGATEASFLADQEACRYEALKNSEGFGPNFGKSYATAIHRSEITNACLRQKGYTTQPPGITKQKPFKPIPVDIMENGQIKRIN